MKPQVLKPKSPSLSLESPGNNNNNNKTRHSTFKALYLSFTSQQCKKIATFKRTCISVEV